jgi:hypothetical protein
VTTIDESALLGSRITSTEGSTRRYRSGRVCREVGCETKLSVYNDAAFCSLHAPMVVPRTRGKKLAS